MASSAITNESRSPITHEKTKTRFEEVLWKSLGNLFNHCLGFYLDTRGFFPKNSFNHPVRGSRSFPKQGMFIHPYFSIVRTVLARLRNSFGLIQTSSHGNKLLFLARPRSSFDIYMWQGVPLTSTRGNIRLVLARPSSSFGLAESSLLNVYFCNNARQGLCCHFLWAN
jgi:hypothetical protein